MSHQLIYKRNCRLIALIAILFFTPVLKLSAQTKTPTKEHKKLSALAGKWTIKGMEDRVLEICEMYEGQYFMVCNSEVKTKAGGLSKGVSVFGYSEDLKSHTYYHYGSTGYSQLLTGNVDDAGNLHLSGEETRNGKLVKTRVVMTKISEGYDFKEETSTDNGPWKVATAITYLRVK